MRIAAQGAPEEVSKIPASIPATTHAQLADKLNVAIVAAPHLQYHPDLAHAAASSPGNIVDAAQNLAGLHLLHTAVSSSVDWAHNQVEEAHASGIQPETPKTATLLAAEKPTAPNTPTIPTIPVEQNSESVNTPPGFALGEKKAQTNHGGMFSSLENAGKSLWAFGDSVINGKAEQTAANMLIQWTGGQINRARNGFEYGSPDGPNGAPADPLGARTLATNPKAWVGDIVKAGVNAGNSLQRQYQVGEWIYNHKGPEAFGEYWASQAVLAAVSYGLTHDPAMAESAATAAVSDAVSNAPDVAAAAGDTMNAAATAGEEVSKAKMVSQILDTLQTAKNNVLNNVGMDTATGLRSSTITANDLATAIKEEFVKLIDNQQGIEVGQNVQEAIDKNIVETASIIRQSAQLLRPFRAGMAVGEMGGSVGGQLAGGVGKVVSTLTKLMDSKTLSIYGTAAPALTQEHYKEAWDKSKNEFTIGESLSSAMGLGKTSAISHSVDFIVSMVNPVFVSGRAIGIEKEARDSIATLENLDRAYSRSPRYLNALRSMQGKSIGELMQLFPDMPAQLADQIAKLGKDSSVGQIHQLFKDMVTAEDYTKTMRIPRMGLYGMLKAAKLSDSKMAAWFTHIFVKLPTVFDEKGIQSADRFLITDRNAVAAIGNMLAAAGVDRKAIRIITDQMGTLLAEKDIAGYSAEARNIMRNALHQFLLDAWEREVVKNVSKDMPKEFRDVSKLGLSELERKIAENTLTDEERQKLLDYIDELQRVLEPHQAAYDNMRQAIGEYVDQLVRFDGPGVAQDWGGPPNGIDLSKVIDSETNFETGAAILFNERGDLHFVDYKEMAQQFRRIMAGLNPHDGEIIDGAKQLVGPNKAFRAMAAHTFFWTSDLANKVVNDYFFKPLALLTPGWALRVSASEAALNTARLGPINMAAGYVDANLIWHMRSAIKTADKKAATLGIKQASASDIEKELFAALDRDEARRIAEDQTLSGEEKQALIPPPRARAMMTTDGVAETLGKYGIKDVPRATFRNIALFARGVMAGIDKNVLRAIGHEGLIESATYLAFMHDSWLPQGIDSRHAYVDETIDVPDKTTDVKTGRRNGKAKVKTKRVRYGENYAPIALNHSGFYEAWRYNAAKFAMDEQLGRPLIQEYLGLVNEGLTGTELHEKAVQAARNILDNVPASERETMARNFHMAEPRQGITQHNNPLDSWAEVAVGKLEGIVRGKGIKDDYLNAYLHKNLLQAMAFGDIPQTTAEFVNKYGLKTLKDGTKVKFAPEEVARSHVGRSVEAVQMRRLAQRASTAGHEKVLGPIVNFLSRQPVYVVEFHQARMAMQDLVDRGIYTVDQANLEAQVQAAQHMMRFIHNPLDKTRFEEGMRVVAPFYFAQNQAWRRMGRLFASNPGAFMQYMASMLAVTKWVSKTVQKNNNMTLFNIPLSALMFGIPYTGSLSSLQTMDPFAGDMAQAGADSTATPQKMIQMMFGLATPNFGPIVTVPAHMILENKHATNIINLLGAYDPFGKNVDAQLQNLSMGQIGSTTPLWESLVPNSVARSVLQLGMFASGIDVFGLDSQLIQAQNQAILYMMTEGANAHLNQLLKTENFYNARWDLNQWMANQLNENNPRYNEILQQSKQMAMEMWLGKLALSAVSPVSIGVGEAEPQARALYQKYINKYSTAANPYKGQDKFFLEHPDMVAVMVGNTSSVLGNYLPETKPWLESYNKNPDLSQQYPLAAMAWLGGYTGKQGAYYQPAALAQINAGLRKRNAPADYIKGMQVMLGNMWYYDELQPIMNQARNNGVSGTDVYNFEQQQVAAYGNQYNPEWQNEFATHASSKLAVQAYDELLKMTGISPGRPASIFVDAPKGSEAAKFVSALRDFQTGWMDLLIQYQQEAASSSSGITYADIKQWWTTVAIPALLQQHPNLKSAVYAVLANLG